MIAGIDGCDLVEHWLVAQPKICVPTIVLHGEASGIQPPQSSERHDRVFGGPYQRRVLPRVGHNLPQAAPQAFADAVLALLGSTG